MFHRLLIIIALVSTFPCIAQERVVSGLSNPESVIVGPDGRIYISQIGDFNKDKDGAILVLTKDNKLEVFTPALDDPKGLAVWKDSLYVTDKTHILKIDSKGKATEWASKSDFPQPPQFLNDPVFDSKGTMYVSDMGNLENPGKGAIFKITGAHKVSLVTSEEKEPAIKAPNGLLLEGDTKLLIVDFATGELHRLHLQTNKIEKLADGFGGGDGLVRDKLGMLYISDWINGRVYRLDLNKRGAKPIPYKKTFQSAADISLDAQQTHILVPDMKAGTLTWLPK